MELHLEVFTQKDRLKVTIHQEQSQQEEELYLLLERLMFIFINIKNIRNIKRSIN